jgi:hypothetical protein
MLRLLLSLTVLLALTTAIGAPSAQACHRHGDQHSGEIR